MRRQQRDTTTPTRVYDAAREVVKRGEAKAGVALPANVRFYDAADSHQHDLGRGSWDSLANHRPGILIPRSLFRLVRVSPIITVGLRRKHHTTMNCIIIAVRLMSPFYLFDTLQQRSLEASSRHPNIELGGIRQDHGKLSLLDFLWSGVPLTIVLPCLARYQVSVLLTHVVMLPVAM